MLLICMDEQTVQKFFVVLFFFFNLIIDFTSFHHQYASVVSYWNMKYSIQKYSKAYTVALGSCCGTVLCSPQKTTASAVVKANCFLNGSSINRMLNKRIKQINKTGKNLTDTSNLNLQI